MTRATLARTILFALPLVAAAHVAYYYPQLPERVPSHFGPGGAADAWMSKSAFAGFYLILLTFFTLLMGGIAALLRHLPTETINMANREYWLAPERREATLARLSGDMSVFGVALNLFLIATMHLSFQAALDGTERLNMPVFLSMFVGFFVFTGWWLLGFYRNYRLPC
jgi:uncharacterized membrane protein